MKDNLPETPESLERFAAQVAHDFNNLLTGILGNLELMQRRAARSGEHGFDGYLDGARRAGGRAVQFSQRLLAFSGPMTQEATRQPLGPVLHEVVKPFRERGKKVTLALAGEDVPVLCDPAQAELALSELLHNAEEATAQGGRIFLEAEASARHVIIRVRDTGCGMAPEMLAQAGQAFFTTRSNGTGKGLGLPIAARFARQAGGGMHIESAPGEGCTVTLTLPRG
jgi:hypothetical protein